MSDGRSAAPVHPASATSGAASPDDRSGLAARAAAGDEVAFAALYRGTVERTFRYLRLHVGDDGVAADLTQDVWVRAMGAVRGLADPSRFDAWLLAITRNALRRHWHRRRLRHAREAPLDAIDGRDADPPADSFGGHAADDADAAWQHAALVGAVASLSALQRDVIALRFGAGYSVVETAALLDRSEAAVKQLQHRALVALRERLQEGDR